MLIDLIIMMCLIWLKCKTDWSILIVVNGIKAFIVAADLRDVA